MNLTPRLLAVSKLITPCHTVADIGCDHGKLGEYLLQSGIVKQVIACDISAPSLDKARKLGLQTRLGDGLDPIVAGEAQCVVIAGMGGLLIADIIHSGKDKLTQAKCVLQPMQNVAQLRRYIRLNNFVISKEILAQEGDRIYNVMLVIEGQERVKDEFIYDYVGQTLLYTKPPLFLQYIDKLIKADTAALDSIVGSSIAANQAREGLMQRIMQYRRL